MSDDRNRSVEQDARKATQGHIETLQKLKDTAEQQSKREIVDALTVALELLETKAQDERGSDDDMQLSGRPEDVLLELANRVKNSSGTTGPVKRAAAVNYLTRLAKN